MNVLSNWGTNCTMKVSNYCLIDGTMGWLKLKGLLNANLDFIPLLKV